jgi:macrolide transport system ATP-binding/permease protein
MKDISAIGTNTIRVYPGSELGDMHSAQVNTLTVDDANVLAKQSYLESATPNTFATGVLIYRNVSLNAELRGVSDQYFNVMAVKINIGRLFHQTDVKEGASVVIIDENTHNKLFPHTPNPVGEIVFFNKKPLMVIGVTEKQDGIFSSSDTLALWSPYTTVMSKITGEQNIYSITAKVKDNVDSAIAEQNLTKLLTVKHGGKTDFYTFNADSIKKTIESTTNTMTMLVSSIALISLIVGGVGVMNIMLVSVTERIREIGVRMALGARQYNILQQFLIEAILICFIGGLAGILLSYLIALIFNAIFTSFAMSFSFISIIVALGCSSFIGILFGFMPARSAARLNPIEALARD